MSDSWYAAPAILTLRDEVNAAFPHRDKASDGIIGDARHQAESFSDHNPDGHSIPPWCVRAIDVDSGPDGDPARDLVAVVLKATIGDPRVYYVISDRRIFSRTYGWQPRVYTGTDPHTSHVHVSLRGKDGISEQQAHDLAFDTSTWLNKDAAPVKTLPPVRMHRLLQAARHRHLDVAPVNVRRLQKALTARSNPVPLTGRYDVRTRASVVAWQKRLGYRGADADGIIGVASATRLFAGLYRLLP